jgi:hypothetical protein
VVDAKKNEKLRIMAKQKAEKAKMAAENRNRQSNMKVHTNPFPLSFVDLLSPRLPNGKQHHRQLSAFQKVTSAHSLHCNTPFLWMLKMSLGSPMALKISFLWTQKIHRTSLSCALHSESLSNNA